MSPSSLAIGASGTPRSYIAPTWAAASSDASAYGNGSTSKARPGEMRGGSRRRLRPGGRHARSEKGVAATSERYGSPEWSATTRTTGGKVLGMDIKAKVRKVLGRGGITFTDSPSYWDEHYRRGGNSGGGSYGRLADFKAEYLNRLVEERRVKSVVEYGCGDGNQLSLARYPRYVGLDVSPIAVQACRRRFARDPTKTFEVIDATAAAEQVVRADMSISLDVIYHLIEDNVFEQHLAALFSSGERFVVIYAVDEDRGGTAPHVRFRRFTDQIAADYPEWHLADVTPGPYPHEGDDAQGSDAGFYLYERE